MGDRVSIAFKNGNETSVTLFHHWGGMEFVEKARDYAEDLRNEIAKKEYQGDPIGRLEPNTVMVDFIRYLTIGFGQQRVTSSLYLGKDGNDGDNSDNGHHIINLIREERNR